MPQFEMGCLIGIASTERRDVLPGLLAVGLELSDETVDDGFGVFLMSSVW
jgi:hypothetical protein